MTLKTVLKHVIYDQETLKAEEKARKKKEKADKKAKKQTEEVEPSKKKIIPAGL